jgi:prolipoprotein diacylglyceryltransferase
MSDEAGTEEVHSAAATLFDLRTVIATLFGVYGILLVIIAFTTTTQAQLDKAAGIHMNMWAGVIMIVVSVVFIAWVRLKPPVTAAAPDDAE